MAGGWRHGRPVGADLARGPRRQGSAACRALESGLLRRPRHGDQGRRDLVLSRHADRPHAAGAALLDRAAQGRGRQDLSGHAGGEGRDPGRRRAFRGGRDERFGQRRRPGDHLPHQCRRRGRGRAGASAALRRRGRNRRAETLCAGARAAGSAGGAAGDVRACRRMARRSRSAAARCLRCARTARPIRSCRPKT